MADGPDPLTPRRRAPEWRPGDGDGAYYDGLRNLLEGPYLSGTDVRAQSGFSGDEARWERARRIITAAVDRDGSFLDVGCANGLLMESIEAWCAEEGFDVATHGLDLSAALCGLARQRLPAHASRIHVGNAMTWDPPQRYDFLRTELGYVPPGRERAYVDRLLTRFLDPGGRLIVCSYGSARRAAPRAAPVTPILAGLGFEAAGSASARDTNGVAFTEIAWLVA